MNKLILSILFSISIVCNIFSFNRNTNVFEFIKAYKNLEYNKAKNIVSRFKDENLRKVCLELILVKTNSGQNEINFNESFNRKLYSNDIEVFKLLSNGYYNLYKYPYKTKAYEYFQKSYHLSLKENLDAEITKLSLLGILDVYYREVNRSNTDVLEYLKIFKNLSNDITDEFYHKLHYIHYFLRVLDTEELPPKKTIKEFETLIHNFKKSHPFWAEYYATLGIVYRFTDNKQKAIIFFQNAIKSTQKKPFLRTVRFMCQQQLAEMYREKGDMQRTAFYLKEAEKNINKADTLASQYGLNIYNSFYNYDIENYKKAYELLKLASIQGIQLGYKKNAYEISRLNVKYETERKEKELLKTKAQKVTTELKLNKQKQFTYGLLGGLCFLSLLGYFIIQRNQQRLKAEKQQAIIQEKEAGLQAIIQAEENERSKIARELHDGVVQQIGSVILNSRNILDKLGLLDKPESQQLLKNLEDSNQDIRTISHQMMPRALEELGLISALDDLLNTSLPLKGIKVNYEHFNIKERLPQKIEKTLYRIVQELTNNILKHSEATEVSIQLFKAQSNIMLIVEDNGVGIKTQKSKGIGLRNINSRLDMVNGSVNFEPSPESGTLVTVKIPLNL